MTKMNLNIQRFAFTVNQGNSQAQANAIIAAASDLSGEINKFNNNFINQMNVYWYTELSKRTTDKITESFNSDVVAKITEDFNTYLSNYIATVNNLLAESNERISGSLPVIQNVQVGWDYAAGATNILPDESEVVNFVNSAAKPSLERISEIVLDLKSKALAADDMDDQSKSALANDLTTVSNNAKSLAESIERDIRSAAEQEEANVKETQTINQERM